MIDKQAIKQKIEKLKETGFFSIFLSNILAKVVVFLGNIVVVRILSKNEYGIYAYVINTFSMLYILDDFGASSAALQYITEQKENKQKQQAILKYAIKLGLIGSAISGLLILISPLFFPFKIVEAKYLVPILCLIPIFSIVKGLLSVVLRANFENKKYALLNLTETISSYLFLIPLCFFFGVKGAILSRYCYTIVALILGIYLTRNLIKKDNKQNQLDKGEKKSFNQYALATQLNSAISSLLIYIDTFMVGLILSTSKSVASYKVASTIPAALSFLPTCVVVYVLPYFVANNKNKEWLKSRYYKLIQYGMLGYGLFTIGLIVFSKVIFNILYTQTYQEAILPFCILMVGFFFSATLKIPTNNILCAMKKLKSNLVITILSGILNALLNVIFIQKYGIVGAALTTTFTNIFSSIIGLFLARKAMIEVKE